MMGEFSVWHLLIVAFVFLALFGYRKLPDAARSVGRSMRIFRAEMHLMRDEDAVASRVDPTPPATLAGEALPPAPVTRPRTVPTRSEPVTDGDA